jgi:DNA-binding transcriptional LysR family regulator
MTFDERLLKGMGVVSAIVDSGSFAGAGEALDMSQSGVSRAIARLEGRLGIRLFDRTTHSVAMTDEGRRIYDKVSPLLESLEEAVSSAAQGATVVRGRLRVNVDPFFSRQVLAPRLGVFIERYPELELELVGRDQLGDMVAEGFDLAVRFGHPRESALIGRKLLETRMVTVAAPFYLKKHGRPKVPDDLKGGHHLCIQVRDPATGRPFAWEFRCGRKRQVVETTGRLTVSDAGTLHAVCLAGYGIARIKALGIEQHLADGRLVDLFPDWPDERFPLYALYRSRRHTPAKVRTFLDFVTSICGAKRVTTR